MTGNRNIIPRYISKLNPAETHYAGNPNDDTDQKVEELEDLKRDIVPPLLKGLLWQSYVEITQSCPWKYCSLYRNSGK